MAIQGEQIGTAVLVLTTDAKGLDKGLKDAEKRTEQYGKQADEATQKTGKFSAAMAAVGVAAVAAAGALAAKLISAVKDSTKAFEQQENATTRLAVAIRQNPLLSGESLGRLRTFASEMQRTTIFGDEQIEQALSMAAAVGLTEDQVKRIGVVAADVASSGLMDYETAVEQLSRTYTGLSGTLGRYIPGVSKLTEEELKHGAAVDLVAGRYAGMAVVMADTVSGVHTRVKNLYSDIQETIGSVMGLLRKRMEDQLIPVLEGVNKWFTANAPKIYAIFAHLPEVMRVVGETIIAILRRCFSLETISDVLSKLGEGLVRAIGAAFKGIFTAWRELIAGFVEIAKEFGNDFWKYFVQGYVNAVTALPRKGLGILGNLLGIEGMANLEQTLKLNLVGEGVGAQIGARLEGLVVQWGKTAASGVVASLKEVGSAVVEVARIFDPEMKAAAAKLAPILEKGAAEFEAYQAKAQQVAEETAVIAQEGTLSLTRVITAVSAPLWTFGEKLKDGADRMVKVARSWSDGIKWALESFTGSVAWSARVLGATLKSALGDLFSGGGFSLGGALASNLPQPAGESDLAAQLAISNLTAFGDALQQATLQSLGFAGQVMQSVITMGPLGLLFEALKPVLEGVLGVLAPLLNEALAPLMGFLVVLGQIVGESLAPQF